MTSSISGYKTVLKKVRQSRIDFAEKFYAFATFMSLIWQYCTVIYYPFVRSAISSFVTIADLLIWALAWVLLTIQKRDIKIQLKVVLPVIILFVLLLVKLVQAGSYSNDYFAPSRSIYQMYSLIYALFFGLAFRLLSDKTKRKLLFYFYIILTVTVLPSFVYVFIFKDAIRDEAPFYGIIDFQYIYSVIPLVGITIIILICGKLNKQLRLVMLLMVLTNTAIILVSNFATAMMFICFTVLLGLLIAKKVKLKKLLIAAIILLLAVILFRNLIAEIFFALERSNIFSVVMKHRLHDIGSIFSGEDFGWSFIARFNLMNYSWQAFLKNPIFGVSFDSANILGFHDTWFTLLGYSGIVGLVLVIITVALYLRLVTKQMENKYYAKSYLLMLSVVLLLSFFNPILSKSILMIALGIMPALSCYFEPDTKIEKSKRGKNVKYNRAYL